jgi:hypothetical protein
MLVLDYLQILKVRIKNLSAFKSPNRKPKVKLRKMKKAIDEAAKRITKAEIQKYFR